jgi:PAS domain S-box-containing protein
LVENSAEVSPEEFDRSAARLVERCRGIQAVEWCPIVPAIDADRFVENTRTLVEPEITLMERTADGDFRPLPRPPPRPEVAPITYVFPKTGNEGVLGYDIFSAPTADALQRARGRPGFVALSKSFQLAQGGEGIVFCLFVERADSVAPPPLGGDGFVQLVLRLDTALEGFFGLSANLVHDTLVLDVTAGDVPLYLQPPGQARPETRPAIALHSYLTPHTRSRELAIGGRVWRIYFRPSAEWLADRRSSAPFLALIGGVLLTVVGLAYFDILMRQAGLVRRQVDERTAELNESRALLQALVDHNPSAIWVKDTSLRYQLINSRFLFYHDVTREGILGRADSELFPAFAAETEARDTEVLTTRRTLHFEGTYSLASGSRTFLVTKFPLLRADGSVQSVAAVATDITELRAAEAAQLTMERKLLETQKLESLGVLAGGVAHDFNNLLTGILGHASLLLARTDLDRSTRDSLLQIEHASQRAAELCRQMLAYSGQGRIAVQPVELGELVRDTAGLLQLSLARRARLCLDLAPNLPPVIADITQIRQIVMNLVLNASEALIDGSGEITLRTGRVRADAALFATCVLAPELPGGDYVLLEVADTGAGMSPAVLARIFDPFYTTKFTGRGLGLAAVLGIVRGHQGALHVASEPGHGTTFRLYLPAATAVAAPSPAAGAHAAALPALRILLVDDDAAVRETVSALLVAFGHTVESASDGTAALARFSAAPAAFDLAVLDLTMPGLGGPALLRRLRQLRPGLPVLLISGYTEEHAAAAELLAEPRVAFLAKPFNLAALRAKLAAVFAPPA